MKLPRQQTVSYATPQAATGSPLRVPLPARLFVPLAPHESTDWPATKTPGTPVRRGDALISATPADAATFVPLAPADGVMLATREVILMNRRRVLAVGLEVERESVGAVPATEKPRNDLPTEALAFDRV